MIFSKNNKPEVESPCIFCGAELYVTHVCCEAGEGYAVSCDRCGLQGPLADTEEYAGEIWAVVDDILKREAFKVPGK